eukprot:161990_1
MSTETKTNIPYSEPYYNTYPSPYYTKSHFKFRTKIRNFVEKELIPYASKWDEQNTYPIELHKLAYKYGIYAPHYPIKYGGQTFPSWDYFHWFIYHDEIARCANGGLVAGLFISLQIGLGPIMSSSCINTQLRNKIAPQCIKGDKIICLAVTEPSGGSDVSNIKTTAITDPNNPNYYIVNGEKYFITSGMRADYFSTAVKTDLSKKSHDAMSMILIERTMDGIYCSRMKTQGWWSSNTAYVTFKDVRVPKSNLISEENKGWNVVMNNFNHERFMMATHSNRYARICIEEAIKWARKRKTFGKKLIENQVIRHKIIDMVRRVESTHALLENIAYMTKMGCSEKELAGIIAIVKVQCSKNMEFCAREAVQIFGGRGYIRGGIGNKVERIYREVRVNAIGGGSEEIMIDLAARQAKL